MNKIHIGTSGWSYAHWRGLFYPKGVPVSKWLAYYARQFRTTEINGSFYRLPTPVTVVKWMDQVPDDFIFSPKMSRFLTHMKKLNNPEEPLQRFFGIFEPMKDRLGPVLIQLPALLRFNYDTVQAFYRLLKEKYAAYDFVMEVRHPDWLEEKSLRLLSDFSIGLVLSHSEMAFPYAEIITAKNVYIRFHGPKELYASSYDDEMLKDFAFKIRNWENAGHTVWAYFNNDIHGYATGDAQRLRALLKKKEQ